MTASYDPPDRRGLLEAAPCWVRIRQRKELGDVSRMYLLSGMCKDGLITKTIDAEKSDRHIVIFNIEITDKGRAERDRMRLIAPSPRAGRW